MTFSESVVSVRLTADQRLLLQLGNESHFGDTYFLGLDPQHLHAGMTVQDGMRELLQAWITALSSAPDNSLLHLPFDFADEFTRWLACQTHGQDLSVVVGWAPVEGWSISPTDASAYADSVRNFQPDEPLVIRTFYRPRFLSQLRASLAKLNAGSPE